MKFSELFEMPTYHDTVFPKVQNSFHVISRRTLEADYTVVSHREGPDGTLLVAAINNDHTRAIIGDMVDRQDTTGLQIKAYIDFKDGLNLKVGPAAYKQGALQIDYVQTDRKTDENGGYAYELYKSLIQYGFSIISDNVQFLGGQVIWKKIVRKSAIDNHNVYVLQNGQFLQKDGKPIIYDGTNITDDELWGPEGSDKHHYTLFLATTKS